MDTEQIIEDRVVSRINEEIGNSSKITQHAHFLIDSFGKELNQLKTKLDYKNDVNRNPYTCVFKNRAASNEIIDTELEKVKQFTEKLQSQIISSELIIKSIELDFQHLGRTQQMIHYFRIIRDIQGIGKTLETAIEVDDVAPLVNIYLVLYESNDNENSIIGRLNRLDSPSLKSYATQTAIFWHERIIEKISKEFENVLKSMRWGQKALGNSTIHSASRDDIEKIQALAEYLFLIKTPNNDADQVETVSPNIVFKPISTVTKLLLAAYRQRFIYHFSGERQTNRLDKPEWYLTQIITWSKVTHIFVGQTFHQSAIKAGNIDFNIRLEFLRGLVQLAVEKLVSDIAVISKDEYLFSHLLDEIFAFESELRQVFGYPPEFVSVISVITQSVYLMQWLSIEENFCTERMDRILQDPSAWTIIDANNTNDALKIPKCADQFMCLLDAIKDRYFTLVQPCIQLQFLALQLDLIENFRVRLVQLHSNGIVESIMILNALNYITMVLREWGENVHYLHLHAELVQHNDDEIGSVFDYSINELTHWTNQVMESLVMKAFNEIRAKSMTYRHIIWSSIPDQEPNLFTLSASAGEMFQLLVTILHDLEGELSRNQFNSIIRELGTQIDDFFYDNLILHSKFSIAGANQFHYDMIRNLFPLFGQYIRQPELLFRKINDSTKLLTILRGSAILLFEIFRSGTYEECSTAIQELGLVHLNNKTGIDVLERREDIHI